MVGSIRMRGLRLENPLARRIHSMSRLMVMRGLMTHRRTSYRCTSQHQVRPVQINPLV